MVNIYVNIQVSISDFIIHISYVEGRRDVFLTLRVNTKIIYM